jgi:type IV secretory pathway VirB10-like protein
MSTPSSPGPSNSGQPPFFVVEDRPSTSSSVGSTKRKSAYDTTIVWVMLGLIGIAIGIYAVKLAYAPPSAPEPPAANVAATPEPAAEPAPKAAARRPRERRAATPPAPEPKEAVAKKAEPEVEYVTEMPKTKDMDSGDPTKANESGSLFDQQNGAAQRGRRGSFDNPTHGRVSSFDNPPHGYTNNRAPNPTPSDRPNTPDPSFRKDN